MGGTWIVWPHHKILRNSELSILGLNEGKNQNPFFLQFTAILYYKYGLNMNFCQTHHLGSRTQNVKGNKTAHFSSKI